MTSQPAASILASQTGQALEEFVLIYDVVIAGAGPVGLFLAC